MCLQNGFFLETGSADVVPHSYFIVLLNISLFASQINFFSFGFSSHKDILFFLSLAVKVNLSLIP